MAALVHDLERKDSNYHIKQNRPASLAHSNLILIIPAYYRHPNNGPHNPRHCDRNIVESPGKSFVVHNTSLLRCNAVNGCVRPTGSSSRVRHNRDLNISLEYCASLVAQPDLLLQSKHWCEPCGW